MAKNQLNDGRGPGTSYTSMQDGKQVSQDAAQMRASRQQMPSETNGTGMTKSPTINTTGMDPMSMRIDVAAGSGAYPRKAAVPIATSAPKDAHTLDRAPSGWLK